MAKFNVVADLSQTPLTRQDLFDAWTTATLTEIAADELADGFLSITLATSMSDAPSSPQPGALMWVAEEQVMYCYHDEVDDTGVSLWLAIGPDMFETACLLGEPAFPGSLVDPWYDRWVKPTQFTDSILSDGVTNRMIGNVHSGVPYPLNTTTPVTQESGTWVRVGIDGFIYGWIANASGVSTGMYTCEERTTAHAAVVDAAHPDNGAKGGLIKQNVSVGGRIGTVSPFWGFCGQFLYTSFNEASITGWGQHVRYKFQGFQDQQDRTP